MFRVVAAAAAALAGAAVCGGCAAGGTAAVAPPRAAGATDQAGAPAEAPTAAAAPALPEVVDDVVASDPAAAVAAVDEAALRERLARDVDPTAAALTLVVALAAEERHDEALAVLDTALRRRPAVPLRIARAELCRDLGQRHLAVRELVALRQELGAAALAPDVLFGLAELQWLEGEELAAAATLREFTVVHGAAAWAQTHAVDVRTLAAEIDGGGAVHRLRTRDALANLRGAPLAEQRLAMLEHLARSGAAGRLAPAVVERALLVALGDDAAAVRARALERLPPAWPAAAELAVAALADPDPLVRRVAAARAGAWLPPAEAVAALREALAVEADPGTFVALHQALAAQLGIDDPIDRDAAATPAARAALVARWRTRTEP